MDNFSYLIGIDGGGTGTRVVLGDARGAELAQATAGPSGLGLGIARAWQSIEDGCRAAFADVGIALDWPRCVLGCGLAGVNNRDWLAAFRAAAPNVAGLAIETDAYTTLLGAHGGEPGVIVALGTGSIAAVLDADGASRIAGGFGFPSGDEASGAWFGLRAIVYAQQTLDGRAPADAFAQALLAHTGATDRDSLIVWLCAANQTAYASLAPAVLAHRDHPFVAKLLAEAGAEIAKMVVALDPSGTLPAALCGGLGKPLLDWVPDAVRARLRAPLADSAHGALRLALREAARLRDEAASRA
ncbi:glucosamine kinase nucleotide-binding domain-containing protein [Paraburkholderia caballeronis]|uniref:Glucosamine kinase n=1 Tax=Paraburkholderia caballeronis TaxID=416943 RepID=A0A1H7SNA6_9BURK|nr:BadF/BadG/BcrA/BcrD ATPase family protein [Paraburkholderia caballeronis]PXW22407.1 glucosamine kinase [Paraburkholderia caballeronis]PXW96065.1 glucosamine kinase [Paraburkholderia caballeronis]RAJ92431.1 glucosamine kinase [Paraburkholderia caballeronis]SEB49356.1 glucosamine kinase [Paraburkholderia caballeronis]SEL74130.1 glucosamine kinase [Paraburkholderia caballeronis]